MTDRARAARWADELREFTNRNAGRRTVLEVDGPDYGAQKEEFDYPFRGVAFDARDGRVQIMLGDQASVEHHLTHSIQDPTKIDILRDGGRDKALRVVHGDAQTVLRFIET